MRGLYVLYVSMCEGVKDIVKLQNGRKREVED